jgi:23S rRNA (uracil1939-C5)-methyltransferase
MGKLRGVTPNRWSPRGEAVADIRGERQPLHIWQGIVGETCDVAVDRVGQNRAYGRWLGSRQPHPTRVEPVDNRSDSCAWLHMNTEGQEAAHRTLVRTALDDTDLHDVQLGSWTPCPDGLTNFRYVVKVGFDLNINGRLRMGAWARHTRKITPIPQCTAAAPVLRKVMASLAHHSINMGFRPYDPETDEGVLRAAVLRASRSTGQVLVTLVVGRRPRALADLAEVLGRQCPEIAGIWVHINADEGNAIFGRDEDGEIRSLPLIGRDTVEETLGPVTYLIGPGDFFQTNPSTAEVLYDHVMDKLAPTSEDALVDLYCGVGGMALQAAARGAFVVGIEELGGAVERARVAAHRNKLSARFTAGRVSEIVPQIAEQLAANAPLVTVNPARRGLEEGVVDTLLTLRPRRIAYVSCNARALARDLAQFRERGMQIRTVDLFDMFPHTPHVETVTILEPAEAPTATRRPPRRKVIR